MTKTYFYKKGVMQLGPYPLDRMRALARQGQLGRTHQISSDGGTSWEPALSFPEIFAAGEDGDSSRGGGLTRTAGGGNRLSAPVGGEKEWYYTNDAGEQQGPVLESQLRELIEIGAIDADSNVWTQALGDKWVPVGTVPKFSSLFAARNAQRDLGRVSQEPVVVMQQPAAGHSQGHSGGMEGGVFCRECGFRINRRAVVCPQCGVPVASESHSSTINLNLGSNGSRGPKSKVTAGLLALFLGGIGAHHFYLGNTLLGIIYLVFCLTFIPQIAAFIEGIIFLTMSDQAFDAKYNNSLA